MLGRLFGIGMLLALAYCATNLSSLENSGDAAVLSKKIVDDKTFAHMDAETRQAALETVPDVEIQMTPVMAAMLHKGGAHKKPDGFSVAALSSWLADHKAILASGAQRIPLVLLATGLVFVLFGMKAAGRACVTLCFSLARKWLFVLSIATIAAFAAQRIDLGTVLPTAVWNYPIFAILACLVFLRSIDLNYPVWNSTLVSFLGPVAAKIFLSSW